MLVFSHVTDLRASLPSNNASRPLSTSNVHDALVKSGIDYDILHVIFIFIDNYQALFNNNTHTK
jgi:hypothetical protein